MERINYKIEKMNANISIKEFFEKFSVGKSNIYKLFFFKKVFVNDVLVKEDYILKENDILGIDIEEEIDFLSYDIPLDVIYEDDHILVVNKPVGMIIHPDGNNLDKTLVNVVASYYYKHGINRNVRYLHRIDIETSGVVLFAKDFLTYATLSKKVETHELKREYIALCHNKIDEKSMKINSPIGRDRHVANKYRVGKSSNSKEAVTNYFLIKNYDDFAYVRLLLETGRTHQIRVHMASINHPLLGDSLYGGKKDKISRVALHSLRVSFMDPYNNERMIIEAPLPDDITKLLGDYYV